MDFYFMIFFLKKGNNILSFFKKDCSYEEISFSDSVTILFPNIDSKIVKFPKMNNQLIQKDAKFFFKDYKQIEFSFQVDQLIEIKNVNFKIDGFTYEGDSIQKLVPHGHAIKKSFQKTVWEGEFRFVNNNFIFDLQIF